MVRLIVQAHHDVVDREDFQIIAVPALPRWVRSSVFYQIFPDRFASSGKEREEREFFYWDSSIKHGYAGWWGLASLPKLNYNGFARPLVKLRTKSDALINGGTHNINLKEFGLRVTQTLYGPMASGSTIKFKSKGPVSGIWKLK